MILEIKSVEAVLTILEVLGLILAILDVFLPVTTKKMDEGLMYFYNRVAFYLLISTTVVRRSGKNSYEPGYVTLKTPIYGENGNAVAYAGFLKPESTKSTQVLAFPVFESIIIIIGGFILSGIFILIAINQNWRPIFALIFPILTILFILIVTFPYYHLFTSDITHNRPIAGYGLLLSLLSVLLNHLPKFLIN